MTIRDAAALTGLTRKAIKYCETEGLVRPRVDPENGYRAYGEEEIIRLNLIAALRDLGVPVREIRALVAGEKDLARVLHATLAALEARLKQLEASAAVVRELLAQEPADLGELSARVRHLRETLVSTEARAEHLAEALQRLFPGSFGKLLALLYEPFLPASLATEAQKASWLKLVAYLDTLEEPPADHPFLQLIGSDNEMLLAHVRQQQREGVAKLVHEDEEAIATLRANLRQMMRSLKEDEVLRARHRQALAPSADLFGLIGDRDDRLNALLAELSEDYWRYLEVSQRVQVTSSVSWATA